MTASSSRETFLFLPPPDPIVLRWAPRLAEELPALDVCVARDHYEAAAVLAAGCRAAYGTMTAELVRHAGALEWLQAPAAAPPGGFYFDELTDHAVVVTNLRGTYTDHVATHTVALIYALARSLPRYVRMQARREWAPERDAGSVIHLQQATVLIVGMGAVGAGIARLLQPLGCEIVGVDVRPVATPPPGVARVRAPDCLDSELGQADVVVLTVPHTAETDRLIDGRRIAHMRPGALLVNIGRGGVVDIDAATAALASGDLAGAAFDVFPEEPLPAGHPLWHEPNALLTPHVASVGPGNDDRRFEVLSGNARRFLAGEPLVNVVDKARGF